MNFEFKNLNINFIKLFCLNNVAKIYILSVESEKEIVIAYYMYFNSKGDSFFIVSTNSKRSC